MAKNTSTASNGGETSPRRRARPDASTSTQILEGARQEAARLLAEAQEALDQAAAERDEAEERARNLLLDARASADGVRAEGMELVSNLRQMSDSLRANAERLLDDIQSIHSRMISQLEAAAPGQTLSPLDTQPLEEGQPETPSEAHAAEDELSVPDFVSRG